MTETDPQFERQLQKVDKELLDVEKQLSRLQIRRRELLELKESLKNKQLQKKSLERSAQNWDTGEFILNVFKQEILMKFLIRNRRVSLVKESARSSQKYVQIEGLPTTATSDNKRHFIEARRTFIGTNR